MKLTNLTTNNFELMEEAGLYMIQGGIIYNVSYQGFHKNNSLDESEQNSTRKRLLS
ncbi:hypothetical protein [Parabacteroides sp. Marseille-P3160]|uniref:hypothetical protein n=1 Tax=Parabacteroides sp. Marseille-P3160 TaxID=1917887 RepID=UPI00135C715C|nr:hypothetical protein [Parabacteroides sp. Marseille-P3160]